MTDAFTRIRSRAATVITRFGSPVLFFTDSVPAHQLANGSWVEVASGLSFEGIAIRTKGESKEMLGVNEISTMNLTNPVVLLVAAQSASGTPLAGVPVPKLRFRWPYNSSSPNSGVTYTIDKVAEVSPNGSVIYYVVVGDV